MAGIRELRVALTMLCVLTLGGVTHGQQAAPGSLPPLPPSSTVPRSVPFNGQLATPKGDPRTGSVMLTFGLYTDQTGGTPIWTEQQLVALDADGRYAAIIGSTSADGLPADAFAAGTPRWLGVQVEGEKEQPRFMLLSVPYALKAGDADTVSGKAASDFVLSSNLSDTVKSAIKESKTDPSAPLVTPNALVKYQNSGGALTESSTVDVGGKLGVQVPAPIGELDIAGFGSSTTVTLRNGGNAADVMKLVGADGSLRIGSATNANLINLIGPNVGLGTTSPGAKLHINGAAEGIIIQGSAPGAPNGSYLTFLDAAGTRVGYVGDGSSGDQNIFLDADLGDIVLNTAAGRAVNVTAGGRVGIGTTTPLWKLHVDNNGPLSNPYAAVAGTGRVNGSALYGRCEAASGSCYGVDSEVLPSSGFSGYFNGGSGVAIFGNLYVSGSKSGYVVDAMQNADSGPLEPGDVVVIVGSSAPVLGLIPVPTVKKASAAYDTGVAGVVDQALYVPDAATKAAYHAWRAAQRTGHSESANTGPEVAPGASGDIYATDDPSIGTGGYASVVTLGSFRLIKVDASFGAIHAGDLLTTSVNPGHAMKVADKLAAMGAVIGKALADFETGSGTIPVLVTLK